jgi:hypothetical protein
VVGVFDVQLSRYTDDQVLDLSQRGRVELAGEQLRGGRIAEVFTHGSDEGVLCEQGAGEFLVDLLVGVEKCSGVDERLVALDTPERHTGADHQTLYKLVQKVSDAEAVTGSIDQAIVLCLLIRREASDEKILVDLVVGVSRCNLREDMDTTDLVTSVAVELQKLECALRQGLVSSAVLLVLDPVILLARLAAVEGDSTLGTLESAIFGARAGCTTNGLKRCHLGNGVLLWKGCV